MEGLVIVFLVLLKWEVDKIMLNGFREVKCQWEAGEVGRWKGNEVARWEWQESGEVERWEVPGFIQGWGTRGESKILSFCF